LGNEAVRIDTLKARYSVWSYFSETFTVNEISLSGMHVAADEWAGGRWNLMALLPQDTTEASDPFPVDVNDLVVSGGSVQVRSGSLPDSMLVAADIGIEGRFRILPDGYEAVLRRL